MKQTKRKGDIKLFVTAGNGRVWPGGGAISREEGVVRLLQEQENKRKARDLTESNGGATQDGKMIKGEIAKDRHKRKRQISTRKSKGKKNRRKNAAARTLQLELWEIGKNSARFPAGS